MIRYDKASRSTLVWCTSCGWREITVTRDGAWRVASAHEAATHPERTQARDTERKRRARSENVPHLGPPSEDAD